MTLTGAGFCAGAVGSTWPVATLANSSKVIRNGVAVRRTRISGLLGNRLQLTDVRRTAPPPGVGGLFVQTLHDLLPERTTFTLVRLRRIDEPASENQSAHEREFGRGRAGRIGAIRLDPRRRGRAVVHSRLAAQRIQHMFAIFSAFLFACHNYLSTPWSV